MLVMHHIGKENVYSASMIILSYIYASMKVDIDMNLVLKIKINRLYFYDLLDFA